MSDECVQYARSCGIFAMCTEPTLRKICAKASAVSFPKGKVVYHQGEPQTELLVIAEGRVESTKLINGQVHMLGTASEGMSVGANHALAKDPAAVSCRCVTPVRGYALHSDALSEVLDEREASREVIMSLSKEIRRQAALLQTPLFEQHAKPTPYFAISAAATLESFYRSAMNSLLNARLTGQPVASLFPNMHMQIPTRVVYINGFKGIRHLTEKHIDPDSYENPQLVRLGEAVTPGIVMTPVSGMLEAFNAGHMNPESLATRWMRGFVPRCFREVIFGIGLNQLSDYFEERIPLSSTSPAINNAIASLMAGVVSGYLSHVPHNLSTLKLMNPQKSYRAHMADFIHHSESRLPSTIPARARFVSAAALAILFPRGLTVRTTQIVGSFIILNGTINSLKDIDLASVRRLFAH
uniref:Cyclic nucleotide-binding domain-containing protein n=1 Tax=Globisporangium ultimum (strain ATCC 200006 / CBS 805.95 / DAOM BR144) TaxID=431595 RepID=K3XC50_GLOUD